jgi:hypothetical protein
MVANLNHSSIVSSNKLKLLGMLKVLGLLKLVDNHLMSKCKKLIHFAF